MRRVHVKNVFFLIKAEKRLQTYFSGKSACISEMIDDLVFLQAVWVDCISGPIEINHLILHKARLK